MKFKLAYEITGVGCLVRFIAKLQFTTSNNTKILDNHGTGTYELKSLLTEIKDSFLSSLWLYGLAIAANGGLPYFLPYKTLRTVGRTLILEDDTNDRMAYF